VPRRPGAPRQWRGDPAGHRGKRGQPPPQPGYGRQRHDPCPVPAAARADDCAPIHRAAVEYIPDARAGRSGLRQPCGRRPLQPPSPATAGSHRAPTSARGRRRRRARGRRSRPQHRPRGAGHPRPPIPHRGGPFPTAPIGTGRMGARPQRPDHRRRLRRRVPLRPRPGQLRPGPHTRTRRTRRLGQQDPRTRAAPWLGPRPTMAGSRTGARPLTQRSSTRAFGRRERWSARA